VCFHDLEKNLNDDLWHILIIRRSPKIRGRLNEKEAFAGVTAGSHFRVDVD
jgi:hypothetical protein